MEHPQWLSTFETGLDVIDREHRQIFDLVVELRGAAVSGDDDRVRTLAQVVVDRVEEHFSIEEWYLAANAFPGVAGHRRHHRQLSDQGRALAERAAACQDAESLKDIGDAFLSFIVNDIIKSDMDFKSHMQTSPETAEDLPLTPESHSASSGAPPDRPARTGSAD